jgi:hypothetical protein
MLFVSRMIGEGRVAELCKHWPRLVTLQILNFYTLSHINIQTHA